jgi:hypothetical protein
MKVILLFSALLAASAAYAKSWVPTSHSSVVSLLSIRPASAVVTIRLPYEWGNLVERRVVSRRMTSGVHQMTLVCRRGTIGCNVACRVEHIYIYIR